MRIIVLLENKSNNPNLQTKHGLSLYIEACGKKILFDVGPDATFIENANKLGINLSLIDYVVISHGHVDHGGGLSAFLQINDTATIHLQKNALRKHFSMRPGGETAFIGLDASLKNNERIKFFDAFKIGRAHV